MSQCAIEEMNLDSRYIKYKNGLLEQWGRAESPGTAAGGQGYCTVDFAVPFMDASYIPVTTPEYIGTAVTFDTSVGRQSGSRMYIYCRNNANAIVTGVHVYWRAIGRWK